MSAFATRHRAWPVEMALFLALTFGITWSIGTLSVLFPSWFLAQFGPINRASPVFYVMVWAPNIAALILTLTLGGWSGLKDLFARLCEWRVSWWVWIAAIGFFPALMLIVQVVGLTYDRPLISTDVWLHAGSLIFPALLLGPLGEELGWRGYLLPRMLERLSAANAGWVVGVIWMVWHFPAFLMSGLPQSSMSLPVFVVGGVALSVFVTWLFVNARQSILVAAIIPHALANAYGEAAGPMTWINAIVLALGALLLVALLGPTLRGRATPA